MIKDGEFRLSVILSDGGNLLPGEFAAGLQALARTDLPRLKNIAERFQRPEARTLARLLVAMAVLEKPAAAEAGK